MRLWQDIWGGGLGFFSVVFFLWGGAGVFRGFLGGGKPFWEVLGGGGETTTKTGALVFLLAGFGSFSVVHAEQFGTAEEARAMLDRAIAALNANQARALSEFNNTKNTQLHDRDLYISCYDIADGKFTAFPSRAMIGADIREMKLQNNCVGQRAYDAIKSSAEGSIATMEYNFPKPGADKPAPKESLSVRIGNQVCGVSYYK